VVLLQHQYEDPLLLTLQQRLGPIAPFVGYWQLLLVVAGAVRCSVQRQLMGRGLKPQSLMWRQGLGLIAPSVGC
jgi:hypothetical protein